MLIRRPAADVYQAIIDPAITSKFWFSSGSARLDQTDHVTWNWDMYGFSVDAVVKSLEPDKRVIVDWGAPGDRTTIEWVLTARPDNTTFVTVTNYGFKGDTDAQIAAAINSTEGFTNVLAGMKAFLEHNIQLNLVRDRFPDGLPT